MGKRGWRQPIFQIDNNLSEKCQQFKENVQLPIHKHILKKKKGLCL